LFRALLRAVKVLKKYKEIHEKTTSEPRRHIVEMHASAILAFRLAMTLTFDL